VQPRGVQQLTDEGSSVQPRGVQQLTDEGSSVQPRGVQQLTDEGSSVQQRGVKHVRVATVTRFYLEDQVDRVLSERKSFYADPIGITHLDVMNRALDLTLLSMRYVLLQAAQTIKRDYKDIQRRETLGDRQAKVMIAMFTGEKTNEKTAMMKVEDMPLQPIDMPLQPHESSLLGGDLPPVFEVAMNGSTKPARTNLLDVFLAQQRIAAPNKIEYLDFFVRCDPHWSDPRFVSVWLDKFKLDSLQIFPTADKMTKIRDRCSHAVNLLKPRLLHYQDVNQSICELKNLVEKVAEELGIPLTQSTEFAGLKGLADTLEDYRSWRGRQAKVCVMVVPKDAEGPSAATFSCTPLGHNFVLRKPPLEKDTANRCAECSYDIREHSREEVDDEQLRAVQAVLEEERRKRLQKTTTGLIETLKCKYGAGGEAGGVAPNMAPNDATAGGNAAATHDAAAADARDDADEAAVTPAQIVPEHESTQALTFLLGLWTFQEHGGAAAGGGGRGDGAGGAARVKPSNPSSNPYSILSSEE
jgi:hypothetical protein